MNYQKHRADSVFPSEVHLYELWVIQQPD